MTPTARRLALAAIMGAALLTRFADLGSRFFDHDEAIHARLSYALATRGDYRHDPEYHGPVLYHLEAAVFRLAGAGDLQARVPSAAAGVLLIVLLHRLLLATLGVHVAMVASTLAVLSPTLTYYARFNNHDSLVAALTVVMVASAVRGTRADILWFGAALGLALATKLNAVIVAATLGGYWFCYGIARLASGRPVAFGSWLGDRARWLAAAAALCAAIVGLFSITTVMHYLAAGESLPWATAVGVRSIVLDTVGYWWRAHDAARLGGPFYFYVPLLVIYEPLILVAAVASLLYWMRRRWLFLGALVCCLAAAWMLPGVLALAGWNSAMAPSQVVAVAWVLAAAWTVISLWASKRDALAGWVFLAVTQTWLYAYANEKVPWLAVHVVLPWLVVASAVLVEVWQIKWTSRARVALAVVIGGLVILTARTNATVNTVNRSSGAEPLLHTPYATAVRETVRRVQQTATRNPGEPAAVIEPWVQWPFVWYLRDVRLAIPDGRLSLDETAPILLAADTPVEPRLLERYEARRIDYHVSSAWLDQLERGDLTGLLRFTLFHDRWAPERRSAFVLWVKRDAQR